MAKNPKQNQKQTAQQPNSVNSAQAPSIKKEELEKIKLAAKNGDDEAQNKLGDLYYAGVGVDKSLETAVECFRKAAEQGNKEGLYSLGWAYLNGEGVEADLARATEFLQKAAQKGHAKAWRQLAYLYFHQREFPSALKHFQQAAELGDAEAMGILGKLYQEGVPEMAERNVHESFKWLKKAADAGHPDSMHMLGLMYQKGMGVASSEAEATMWLKRAEERGCVSCETLYMIGCAYYNGQPENGFPQDIRKGVDHYRAAAERGHGIAAFNMSRFFYIGLPGIGLQEDYAQAYRWALRAVQMGESDGAYMAGVCCEMGHGTFAEHQIAIQWYMHCLQGIGEASFKYKSMHALGRCYYKGGSHDSIVLDAKNRHGGIPPDYVKAAYWWQRAVDEGKLAEAYNNLGDLYATGRGVPRNRDTARELWKQAVVRGAIHGAGPDGRRAAAEAEEALRQMDTQPMWERVQMWGMYVVLYLLLLFIVVYFVLIYRELADDSWFAKQTPSSTD